MQVVLDLLVNIALCEWFPPGVPGGVVVLFILPDRRREVLSQLKHSMHASSILKDAHFIGIMGVIIDINDMLIKHTAVLFPHVSI